LIVENGYSLLKINNAAKAFLNQPLGKAEQVIPCVTLFFKETTLNKKMRLGYESLSLPETSIFK
jgi:hypothetical protein